MKRKSFCFVSRVIALVLFSILPLRGTVTNAAAEAMGKLAPFIGTWKTLSVYPATGLKVPGELEYRRVLGGNWVLVIFEGRHPERDYWAAVAMIRYDSEKKCYLSHDYFNEKDPVLMTGIWINSRTLRFQTRDDMGRSGIDYTVRENDTIYQENWIHPADGNRQVRLETLYTRISD